MIYKLLFSGQILFYLLSLLGREFEKKELRFKIFFVPYYFCVMNYAALVGLKRYLGNQQSAVWEKARRKNVK
jgi:biofilm PGA synthesis N-glycosyltransferase PgaC